MRRAEPPPEQASRAADAPGEPAQPADHRGTRADTPLRPFHRPAAVPHPSRRISGRSPAHRFAGPRGSTARVPRESEHQRRGATLGPRGPTRARAQSDPAHRESAACARPRVRWARAWWSRRGPPLRPSSRPDGGACVSVSATCEPRCGRRRRGTRGEVRGELRPAPAALARELTGRPTFKIVRGGGDAPEPSALLLAQGSLGLTPGWPGNPRPRPVVVDDAYEGAVA